MNKKLLDGINADICNNKEDRIQIWNCNVNSSFDRGDSIDYTELIKLGSKEYQKFVDQHNLNLKSHNYHVNKIWYNYYLKGDNQELHDHLGVNEFGMTLFSCVYFLKIDPDHAPLTFYNPSMCHSVYSALHLNKTTQENSLFHEHDGQSIMKSIFSPWYMFEVKQYDFVIFPSFLQHAVMTQFSENPRITISFNIGVSL